MKNGIAKRVALGDLFSVLPADAGMILSRDSVFRSTIRAPRGCGDDPYERSASFATEGCSPQMRE